MSITDYIETPKQVIVIEDTMNLDLTIPAKGADRDVDVEVKLYPNLTVKVNGTDTTSDFIVTDDETTITGA